jgi:hypothetical protein
VTQFSRGTFAATPLVPVAMDERAGLGADDELTRTILAQPPWEYLVREDGAVDWNRNGVIDETPVRASPTWAWASCEQSVEHTDFLEASREPAMAWLPDTTAPRLYLVTRARDGTLATRWNTRFDRCDPANSIETCTEWTPAIGQNATPVPASLAGPGGLAAAGWTDSHGAAHVTVAYASEDGKPVAQTLSLAGNAASWSPPIAIGDAAIDGDPALALGPDARTLVFLAPAGGKLVRHEYDTQAVEARWGLALPESWADGSPVAVCAGVGAVTGHERTLGPRLFMAVSSAPDCTLHVAYFDDASSAWVEAGSFLNAVYPPFTNARPAIAYAPFDREAPEKGRFFLAWRPFPTGAGVISMSEGNDVAADATAYRMIFRRGTYLRNLWALLDGSVALGYDARYDANLRAAWVYAVNGGLQFNPFADGVIDVQMKDQDDYAYIHANLACSLDGTCPR